MARINPPHEILSDAWHEIEEPRRREISALLLLASAVILTLALVSYDPADVAGSAGSQSGVREMHNLIGRPGAYIAYACFTLFGWCGFVLPAGIAYAALSRFRGRLWRVGRWPEYLGMVIVLCAVCALLATIRLLTVDGKEAATVAWQTGGALGYFLANRLLLLGEVGGVLVGSCLLLAGLLLSTPFLVSDMLKRLGRLWKGWRASKENLQADRDLEPLIPLEPIVPIHTNTPSDMETLPPLRTVDDPDNEWTGTGVKSLPNRQGAKRNPARDEPLIVTSEDTAAPDPDLGINYIETPTNDSYRLPPLSLLSKSDGGQPEMAREEILYNSQVLESTLRDFGITARVVEVNYGPTITCYELEPAPGIKISRIENLASDITRALKASIVRIVAPIPGKGTVGVEVPNRYRLDVYLRDILATEIYQKTASKLKIGLGKTISGESFVFDLRRGPHLLVAGATGSGKSVCINSIIACILCNSAPHEVKLLLIDPKQVELALYRDIPHLLSPVVTDAKRAGAALRWTVEEMENRYRYLKRLGVRNIVEYNEKQANRRRSGISYEENTVLPGFLPHIVIVIDELADLMMEVRAEVETMIARLAAMARAVGIHLVLATQRPSVDVLTGVIKNNFPARIAFQVSSVSDSRTILDTKGAEALMGRGDMLFSPGGAGKPTRLQGSYISGEDVARLTQFVKDQQDVHYVQEEFTPIEDSKPGVTGDAAEGEDYDELFDEAVQIVLENDSASTSLLQRRMKIGYGRAARLLDMMEEKGIVGPPRGSKPREIVLNRIR